MKTLTREIVISGLIESRIDTLLTDPFYLCSILEDGTKGFNDYTNTELIEEWNCEFDEEIKIK